MCLVYYRNLSVNLTYFSVKNVEVTGGGSFFTKTWP
jgi:hypothetical protein